MPPFYARYPNTPSPVGGATAANQVIEIGLLTSIDGKTPALGQATMAGSSPVVIASDQSSIDVNVASASGLATEAKQDTQISDFQDYSAKTPSGFVSEPFDETVNAYVGLTTNIDTVTYKLAGVTVATLTMSYDGSNRLTGVVRS